MPDLKPAEYRRLQLLMKPCPFCGMTTARLTPQRLSGDMEDRNGNSRDTYHAGCDRCNATGPRAFSWKGAVRLWNMRRNPKHG